MTRFRSKLTIVEATQWHKPGDHPAVFCPRGGVSFVTSAQRNVQVNPGDWIITEPRGDGYYPCNPEVFAMRYEPDE